MNPKLYASILFFYILSSSLLSGCAKEPISQGGSRPGDTGNPALKTSTAEPAVEGGPLTDPKEDRANPSIFLDKHTEPITPVIQKCVKIVPTLDERPHGYALTVASFINEGTTTLKVIDLEDPSARKYTAIRYPFSTSPNYDKFAYISMDRKLIISDSHLNVLTSFEGEDAWYGVMDWQTENTLSISALTGLKDLNGLPGSTVAFDLSSGKSRDHKNDLIHLDLFFGPLPYWGTHETTQTVYNKDYTFSAYIYGTHNERAYLRVMDINKRRETGKLVGVPIDMGGGPIWLKDGETLLATAPPGLGSVSRETATNYESDPAFKGGDELVLIDTKGRIRRLSYFTNQHYSLEDRISISPDETKISFWLTKNEIEETAYLSVFDMKTNILTNYCLLDGDFNFHPIWSPDNKYLLVTIERREKNSPFVLLVDLENQQAEILGRSIIAVGWLKK